MQPETLLHYTLHFYSLKLFLHNICCFLDHIALLITSLCDRGVLKRRRKHHQKLLLPKTLIRNWNFIQVLLQMEPQSFILLWQQRFLSLQTQMFKLNLVVPLPELLERQIVKHYLGKENGTMLINATHSIKVMNRHEIVHYIFLCETWYALRKFIGLWKATVCQNGGRSECKFSVDSEGLLSVIWRSLSSVHITWASFSVGGSMALALSWFSSSSLSEDV